MKLLSSFAAILFLAFPISAQEPELTSPKAEVKLTAGYAGFETTQRTIHHGLAAASFRIYVTRRISVEPEFLYLRNSANDQDYIFQPNVAVDLTPPTGRIVPYLIGGVGVIHHQGKFFGSDFITGQPRVFDASFTGWTASGGGGVKLFLTKRLFIAPEGRFGHEPTTRATVSVGYVLLGRN